MSEISQVGSLTHCRKCGKPLSGSAVQFESPTVMRVNVECPSGHKGIRKIDVQMNPQWIEPLLELLFVCKRCGRKPLSIAGIKTQGYISQLTVLCPVHGTGTRLLPSAYVNLARNVNKRIHDLKSRQLDDQPEPRRWVDFDVLNCGQCRKPTTVSKVSLQQGIATVNTTCPNGHENTRYVWIRDHPVWMKQIMKRVYQCKKCGQAPLSISRTVSTGDVTSLQVLCSKHGLGSRIIPTPYLGLVKQLNSKELAEKQNSDSTTSKPNRWVDELIFKCSVCGEIADVREAKPKENIMEVSLKCPKGHHNKRYFDIRAHSNWVGEVQAYARIPEKEVAQQIDAALDAGTINLVVIASKYKANPEDVKLVFRDIIKKKKLKIMGGTEPGAFVVRDKVEATVESAIKGGQVNLAAISEKYRARLEDIRDIVESYNIDGIFQDNSSMFVSKALLHEHIKEGIAQGVVNVVGLSEQFGIESDKIYNETLQLAQEQGGGYRTDSGTFIVKSQLNKMLIDEYSKLETDGKPVLVSFQQ
ncbi:MAG: hypothetical protein ACTSW4_05015, partial [Candidatus Ranarchaeia archaeon]